MFIFCKPDIKANQRYLEQGKVKYPLFLSDAEFLCWHEYMQQRRFLTFPEGKTQQNSFSSFIDTFFGKAIMREFVFTSFS